VRPNQIQKEQDDFTGGRGSTRGAGLGLFLALLLANFCSLAVGQTAATSIESLVDDGHFQRAERQIKEQLKSEPNDPQLHYWMSKVALAFGRIDSSMQEAEKAIGLNNARADYHAQLVAALGVKLGSADTGFLARLSLARRFQAEAESTLKMDPGNAEASTDLVQFYLEAPSIAGGDKAKAVAVAERLAKIDPAHGNELKAQIAEHEGHMDEAAQLYKRAAEGAPADYEIVASTANFYLNLENQKGFAEAEEFAKKAMKLNPDRIDAYNVLTVLYVKQRRWPDLAAIMNEADRRVPDNLAPRYQAGKFILATAATDEFALAEESLRKYLTQPPEAGSPPLGAAHWRLGQLLEKEGKKEEARKQLRTAVQLNPELKDAKEELKQLQ